MYGAGTRPAAAPVRPGPVPIALPAPPSLPPSLLLPGAADGAARHLDLNIRWCVEDGGVVRAGERIGTLRYSAAGAVPSPTAAAGSGATGGTAIRPRVGKGRWSGSGGGGASPRFRGRTHEKSCLDPDGADPAVGVTGTGGTAAGDSVPVDLRAPTGGFLRLIYKKATYGNAATVIDGGGEATAVNLILAAVEPCEHPAAVGGMCAVCGEDMRDPRPPSAPDAAGGVDAPGGAPRQFPQQARPQQPMQIPRKAQAIDPRERRILDQQRRLASAIAEEREEDEEMAGFDLEGAVASHNGSGNGAGEKKNGGGAAPAAGLKRPAPAADADAGPPTGGGGGARSLSSLLSGARATVAMRRPAGSGGPRPASARRPGQPHRQPAAAPSAPSGGMSKVTVSGGVTIAVSESEARSMSDGQSRRLREEKRLCLVLDLDHTLLHATDDYRAARYAAREVFEEGGGGPDGPPRRAPNPDRRPDVRSILLPVDLPPDQASEYLRSRLALSRSPSAFPPGRRPANMPVLPRQPSPPPLGAAAQSRPRPVVMRHYVKLRPHLREFLEGIGDTYQLSVYTAGTRAYAEAVCLMVCRHVVGADLDEEGLDGLRAEVREAEGEAAGRRAAGGSAAGRTEGGADGEDAGESTGGGDGTGAGAAEGKKKKKTRRAGRRSKQAKKKARLESQGETKGDECAGEPGGPEDAPEDDEPCDGAGGSRWSAVKIDGATGPAPKPEKEETLESQGDTETNGDEVPEDACDGGDRWSAVKIDGATRPASKIEKGSGDGPAPEPARNGDGDDGHGDAPPRKTKRRRAGRRHPDPRLAELRRRLAEAERLESAAAELRRRMFGSRIVSRTDVGDLGKDVKSLRRVFPCGGNLVSSFCSSPVVCRGSVFFLSRRRLTFLLRAPSAPAVPSRSFC